MRFVPPGSGHGSKRRSSYGLRPSKPEEDEMELGVPDRPYEWEREATRKTTTELRHGNPHGHSLPLREQTLNAPLRELSGWNSASKIGSQYGHFLTTRILWEISQVKNLANMNTAVCEALDLPNWAKATAQEYVSGYGDRSRSMPRSGQSKQEELIIPISWRLLCTG
ncbi:hypothetical protein N7530_002180 [Penicillium desertorum]|uniref:Uncharacterized protein n=1 Tax=Penicillium desertorum TaxID=1303715 RepID=A0A9W9XBL7_9EURO|nr:hypothetical protein N7530_002180 [Penicillium desertorum]